MTFDELERKSILILGFGTEGQATYEFIRQKWPRKHVTIADRQALEELNSSVRASLQNDTACTLQLGTGYLAALSNCEVIIKTPGIPAAAVREAVARNRNASATITSHSAIFLRNYPRERIVGVTGTKGKSTTASLIFDILRKAGVEAFLAGNIGSPPLPMLKYSTDRSCFVHEFSSHQLAEVQDSPHIAVLLNIVPEHLDYYEDFAEYAAAKENITRFQGKDDFLVFNADYSEPNRIAKRTRAAAFPFSMAERPSGCHLRSDRIVCSDGGQVEEILAVEDIRLLGAFNVANVLAAVAVARLFKIPAATIRAAIMEFRPLPHRLEFVGTYRGIRFYDDSIATVPEATIGAVDAFGSDVATLILGGHERNLDFTDFGKQLLARHIDALILFPPTGERIWQAVQSQSEPGAAIPKAYFVETMEEAVRLAYENTPWGKVCLLSPASPSFGLFRDYKDRGDSFKAWIVKQGSKTL